MATTATGERIELRLLVGARGRKPVAVALEAPADATVAAAAEALAHALEAEPGQLVDLRSGSPHAADATLAEAGLRHGDRLELLAPGEPPAAAGAPPAAALELAVVGGRDAGRRFPLLSGEHVVGRDPDCAVPLADPALSGRHLQLTVSDNGVAVADLGSRNGTTLEGSALEPERPEQLAPGAVVRAGRTLLTLQPPAPPGQQPPPSADGTLPFNRPPRVRRPVEPAVRPFPAPPDSPQRGRLPLGASLLPLALGLGLYFATKIPTMLFFSALSPLMAVSTYFEDRRSGRKGFDRRRREYREKLAALRDELEGERTRELAARRAAAPPGPELLRRANALDPQLWERRQGDDDFLALRLGSADRPALLTVRLDAGGDESLRTEVEEIAGWYATAPSVPVEAPLGELGLLGVCGPEERVEGLARWLVAEAAALHSPRELVVAAAVDEGRTEQWRWLLWLPHAAGAGPVSRPLVAGPLAARALVEDVGRLVAERRQAAGEAFGAGRRAGWPSVLLVLDERVAPERPLVAEALAGAAEVGVAVIWLAAERRDLPGEATGIVELDHGSASLSYTDARSGETVEDACADGLALDLAEELARALAPVRDTSAGRGGSTAPDSVALLDLLGAPELSPSWVGVRWDERPDGLVAVIGASAEGPFAVDLRRDGPHALVAGMTGAGKSELLRTLIASLAAAHPPSRLTFLLIDYKGGAAFKECIELPHTVGVVTDLDPHLAERALISLNEELRRRERILADTGANDLVDMERRDPERTPASLAIVVDEFATLAKEVPEFIEGIVDVAQRGRSLGVHLVLATQRPGGVVSENIRANTNLRVALRVSEASESADVIGVGDAARIPRDRPGRAYVRTGHGELAEVQTGYVGGVARGRTDDRSLRVRELRFETGAAPLEVAADAAAVTDLRRLVAATAGCAAERGLAGPPSPWLPPLPAALPLDALPPPAEPGREAVLGLLDEPARQLQEPFVVDLEAEGSVLVFGASGSGKTTLLRTLALSLARETSPDELHLYGLDFATRGLGMLEELPHCGAVVTGEDEERTARLFSLLRATLERRKALFAERGVFSLSEYRRSGPDEPLPRIVVLLDGYAGFAAAFERVNLGELVDTLPRLVGDGRPLGVHFVVTADRRGAVPNTLAGIVPAKIVLRMADDDEAVALGIPLRSLKGAKLPPGRGFLPGGTELQIALAGESQTAAVSELAQRLGAEHGAGRVPPIEPLPLRVERASLPAPTRPLEAVLGTGDTELAPASVDLSERHFLVAGPYRSGRSTALETLVESLRAGEPSLELHLLAPRRSRLAALDCWASAAEGAEAVEAAALLLAEAVERRPADGGAAPLVLVIDDGEELAEALCAPALETIVRRGRDRAVRVLAVAERQAAQRAFGGWLRELRKEEHGLLLDPDPDVDGDLLGVRLPRRSNPVFPPGRGYLVERGTIELVQVAAA